LKSRPPHLLQLLHHDFWILLNLQETPQKSLCPLLPGPGNLQVDYLINHHEIYFVRWKSFVIPAVIVKTSPIPVSISTGWAIRQRSVELYPHLSSIRTSKLTNVS
jgi:hypothetical protein